MIVESFSGIRGSYNKEFLETIKRYAKAYADWLGKNKNIVIGMDTRPSSKDIFRAITSVFQTEGLKIISAGVAPTPAIQFAVRELKLDGGVIITGSHNQPEYNGLKFLQKNGAILNPKDSDLLIKKSKKAVYKSGESDYEDKSEEINRTYAEFILKKEAILELKEKIVVDPNGGAAIPVLSIIKEALGDNLIIINSKLGDFERVIEPNHESLLSLSTVLKEKDADIVFGFDCDADRVEIMLKDGSMIDGNYVLGMIVDLVLEESKPKGCKIVTNDVTSGLVRDIASMHGAEVEEVEVGEINVVNRMLELDSPVGGEGSNGGVIVPPGKCRDGILTMLQVIRLMQKRKKSIKDIVAGYPKYYSHRASVSCNPEEVIKLNRLLRAHFRNKKVNMHIRGGATGSTKVCIKESFLWFRNSKTEFGKYRIITDSPSDETSRKLLEEGISIFSSVLKKLKSNPTITL